VLDILMPGMSGFELAQMIKKRKKTASVPIIFLTAYYGENQHILEGYETGAVDYLQKPVNTTILRSKVAVFAELNQKTRDTQAINHALLAEVSERRRVQEQMAQLNDELELRVHQRTSELLQANQALRESEEMLRLAQQAGKVGIWDWNLKTGEGKWTDAAAELFDPRETMDSVTFAKWLSCVHSDDQERVARCVREAESIGGYRDEYRVKTSTAETRWVESIGAVEYDGGVATRMRGVVRDITERKKMELELQDADRRKDEFLAMLGHELRNPLASIRNAVSIMRRLEHQDADLQWCHEVVDRQVVQLTRLVDDLLDVSRISRGKIQLQQEVIEVSTVIHQAVESCQPLIESREHQLNVTLPSQPVYLRGDAARLTQVVGNVLNNAAKYTDVNGGIWLTVETDADNPAQVVIRVRDNGRGLDADSIANLFNLFYQAEHNLDRADGGLGVGLAVVRALVELHGGSVEARSAGIGLGSEFFIRLPRLPAAVPMNCLPAPPQDVLMPAGHLILVVDDNLDAARSLGMLLKLLGHKVVLAHDGQQAIEVALRERPEVIFLDIGLPRLDGYQACRSLRQHGFTREMIVAITGYGQEDDRNRSKDAGFSSHLVKPVELTAIQQLLADFAADDKLRE
ncbi:MAG: response regulator, partial [Planctomycetaceae bacterium]